MIPKQDRQGVRTPGDVERKYNIGQFYAEQEKKDKEQNQKIEHVNEGVALVKEDLDMLRQNTAGEISKIIKDIEKIRISASESLNSINLNISKIVEKDNEQSKAIEELNGIVGDIEESLDALRLIVSELEGQSGSGMIVSAETDSLNSEAIYADKTFTEIDEAINTGSAVKVKLLCSNINDFIYLHLASHLPGVEVTFCGYFNGLPVTLQLQADDTSTTT